MRNHLTETSQYENEERKKNDVVNIYNKNNENVCTRTVGKKFVGNFNSDFHDLLGEYI